jgi:hypothetical protein
MNTTQAKKLRDELQAAGASKAERRDLPGIAARLKELKAVETSRPAQDKPHAGKLRLALIVGAPSAVCLVAGVLLVMFSQSVLPGNPLYSLQKVSDNVAIAMNPSYRGVVMMKRADQVKVLVNNHASSDKVLGTLADYRKQAAGYKSTAANYAAFEYCKQSLQQAATAAPKAEKQAIDNTLQSLDNV